jgi:hypothetical protein
MARISIKGPATEAEAAAVSAALERFLADTSVAPPAADTGMNPWLRAALVEGVSAKAAFGSADPRDLH